MNEKWVMTAQSQDNRFGVPGGHAYAVLDVADSLRMDDQHVPGRFVRVYNPWGSQNQYKGSVTGQSNKQGFYWMTFEEFTEIFRTFSWAQVKRDYKLSFAGQMIPLNEQRTFKFVINS